MALIKGSHAHLILSGISYALVMLLLVLIHSSVGLLSQGFDCSFLHLRNRDIAYRNREALQIIPTP